MGKVYLVGAGPGDPELLTMRASRLLREADIVLHDALVSAEVLACIGGAKVIDIGKRCGTKLLSQEEINSLLVAYAAEHAVVVRLKSGDPSIFGRAGEEIEALVQAGVAFEIVPGVTSAIAAAAAAGISLTDRRFAASVTFATAHRGNADQGVDWDKLVASHSTLAIYMPGSNYDLLARQLCEAGLSAQTPCTVISHAGRETQQVRCCDLTSLASLEPLPAPSLLIVGECSRPLHLAQHSMERSFSLQHAKDGCAGDPDALDPPEIPDCSGPTN